jgi:diguanylate cyclase (GGDEF)-like protein
MATSTRFARVPLERRSPLWTGAMLGAFYFTACAVSALMTYDSGSVALFWPASGVAMAGLMLYGMRHAWFIPVSLLLFHLTLSPVPWAFLPFSLVANTVAALAGVWLSGRVADSPGIDVRKAMQVLLGGVVLAVISASLGILGMRVAGMLPADAVVAGWVRWALGDLLGVASVAPAFLLWPRTKPTESTPTREYGREPERLAWIICLAASYMLVAWGASAGGPYVLGLTALPMVVLMWSAMRFRPWWTALGTLSTSLLIGILAGFGLTGWSVPTKALDAAQLLGFLTLMAVLPIVVAVAAHERRAVNRRLLHNATTDSITGLPNRNAFEESVRALLEAPGGPPRALVYLDLDHLKLVNDTASHAAGDNLIRGIAGVIKLAMRPHDVVGHLGGDEFSVLLHNVLPTAAEERARQMLRDIGIYRCDWEGRALGTTASIGLVPFQSEETDFARLLSQADAACFTAKEMGGDQVCLAALDGGEQLDRTSAMRWAIRAREAVESRTLVLFSQAIVPLHEGLGTGRHFELLLRLRDPFTGEMLLPAQFFPAATRFGLGVRIDREVVELGLGWMERHVDPREIAMCSINLSAEALVDEGFIAFLGDRLRRSSFPPTKLCLEITETSALRDIARAQRFIGQMRDLGCRFALDDFGTGFCSFGYLRSLDVDYFKIDGSFVRELGTSPLALPIVRAITDIAHTLNKHSIAEHTETAEQLVTLARLGVDMAQGFGVHKPEPIERYFARTQPSAMPLLEGIPAPA